MDRILLADSGNDHRNDLVEVFARALLELGLQGDLVTGHVGALRSDIEWANAVSMARKKSGLPCDRWICSDPVYVRRSFAGVQGLSLVLNHVHPTLRTQS